MSASTLRASHDQRKRELVNELTIVMKAAVSHRRPTKEPLPAELTANLCAIVEAILIHGLRDPFFLRGSRYAKYPEPNFWPFVSKFTHRSVTTQIQALNQIKTEIGRSRAWVRIVLNEGGLEHYLGVLAGEKKALSQFYTEEAFIRDAEQLERTKDMLKGLSVVGLAAPTNSSLLNTWTPSPLILAGLVDGKPLRAHTQPVQPVRRRGNSSRGSPEEEMGICALELLPAESAARGAAAPAAAAASSSAALRVPLSVSMASNGVGVSASPSPSSLMFIRAGLQKPSPRGRFEEADDASSVYSHPSMVAAESRGCMEASSDGLVQRRTKRRRNMSRSSSDGSGSGRKLKTAAAAAAAASPLQQPAAEDPLAAAAAERRLRRDSGVESEANHASVSGATESSVGEETKVEESRVKEEKKVPESSPEVEEEEEEEETETMFEMSGDAERIEGLAEMESREEEEEREEEERIEFDEMPSCSLQQELQQLQNEDEGVASLLSGNSLMGRSWRANQRYASSISGDSATGAAGRPILADDPFDGAEFAMSPEAPLPLLQQQQQLEAACSSPTTDTDSCSLPAAVSFGAALRQHVVQQAGGADILMRKRDFSDSTEDGEEPEDEEMMAARKEAEDQESLHKLLDIATEAGLDAQEFRCAMCKSTIGTSYRAYSVCGLDARYYCAECWQQGADRVVPSRLIANWDVKPRKVSPRARVFLDGIADKPVIHLDQANPSLHTHSAAVREVKELREKLQLVAMYLFNCRESVAADLKRRLAPREYLVEDVNVYSYNDLLQVVSGSMGRQLRMWLKYAIGHVHDCALCSQKGFHCEMCNDGSVIYPFQTDLTHRCSECYAVCHIRCFEQTKKCVKCERRRKYSSTRRESTHLEIDC